MFRGWKRGFFEEFEEEMNRLVEMMHSAESEPLVYGFSMHVGSDGIQHVQHFGNVSPSGENARELFTSSIVDEKNNEFIITAEMPGIRKEDIEIKATGSEVVIEAESEGRKYCKSINTPCPVVPDSARAKYNNGVLEVTLRLKEAQKPKGKTVKIE